MFPRLRRQIMRVARSPDLGQPITPNPHTAPSCVTTPRARWGYLPSLFIIRCFGAFFFRPSLSEHLIGNFTQRLFFLDYPAALSMLPKESPPFFLFQYSPSFFLPQEAGL